MNNLMIAILLGGFMLVSCHGAGGGPSADEQATEKLDSLSQDLQKSAEELEKEAQSLEQTMQELAKEFENQ